MNTTTSAPHHRTIRRAAALGVAAVLTLAACGSDDDGDSGSNSDNVSISDPWSRQPVEGQSTSAVYGVISNDGDGVVTAISATSAASDRVELHEVVMNDEGQMSMQEKDGGYEIPAGGSVTLEPGGFHIMMLDIDPATYPQDSVAVTIEFDDGSTFDFTAEVREVEGMDMGGMGDMDHSEMEMEDGSMDEMDDGSMDEMDEG